MESPCAFIIFSIQFVPVISPHGTDLCDIMQSNPHRRAKLIRTGFDNGVSDAADVVKKRKLKIMSQINPCLNITQDGG